MKSTFTLLLFSLVGLNLLSAQHAKPTYASEIARHRQTYKAEFLSDPRSPLTAADTAFLDFFPANRRYRCTAHFERTPQSAPFEIPTYSGQKRDYVQYGILTFDLDEKPQTLNIYQNLRLIKDPAYSDHLFLPFKDLTNGESTYGGGRYLDFKQSDIQDGVLIIDFNKCYNPWCAFSDGFNCPIPPAANSLELEIRAGEKNYKGEKKH